MPRSRRSAFFVFGGYLACCVAILTLPLLYGLTLSGMGLGGDGSMLNVKTFGARGDGITDDTSALNAALGRTGATIYLPDGDYRVTSNLAIPTAWGLIGSSWLHARLVADPGVTTLLPIEQGNQLTRLEHFALVGNATTNARGLIVGANNIVSHLDIRSVRVQDFTGTGAIGAYFRDGIKSTVTDFLATGSTVNVQFESGAAGSTPTTLTFHGGVISNALTKGAVVKTGYNVTFLGTAFESNAQEGLIVQPDAGGVVTTLLCAQCWFEDNYTGTPAQYQVGLYGGAGGGATLVATFDGGYWQPGGAKSLIATGNGTRATLRSPYVPTTVGGIRVESSASIQIESWHPHLVGDFASILSVDGTAWLAQHVDFDSQWSDYTPTYSSNLGNAATTFSGAVTTSLAKYKRIGKTLHVQFDWNATLNAITPTTLRMSLPNGWQTQSNAMYDTCGVINNGGEGVGYVRADGGNELWFYRLPLTPTPTQYTSGGAVGALCAVTLNLQ